jgi:hypothetical protein
MSKGGVMARITITVAGIALAGVLSGAPARAEEANAVIHEVQLAKSAVLLGSDLYQVSDTTRLENEHGASVTLAELPSTSAGASSDEAAVWFEVDESGRLLHLRLTGAIPK